MSLSEKALSYFRKPPYRCNCCQTVVAAVTSPEDPSLAKYAAFGGGNAPEGYCGAAHAVRLLRPDLEEVVTREFVEKAGSVKCREIKGVHHTPCEKCVQIACDVLAAHPK